MNHETMAFFNQVFTDFTPSESFDAEVRMVIEVTEAEMRAEAVARLLGLSTVAPSTPPQYDEEDWAETFTREDEEG